MSCDEVQEVYIYTDIMADNPTNRKVIIIKNLEYCGYCFSLHTTQAGSTERLATTTWLLKLPTYS